MSWLTGFWHIYCCYSYIEYSLLTHTIGAHICGRHALQFCAISNFSPLNDAIFGILYIYSPRVSCSRAQRRRAFFRLLNRLGDVLLFLLHSAEIGEFRSKSSVCGRCGTLRRVTFLTSIRSIALRSLS